jgi:hypothetical protein
MPPLRDQAAEQPRPPRSPIPAFRPQGKISYSSMRIANFQAPQKKPPRLDPSVTPFQFQTTETPQRENSARITSTAEQDVEASTEQDVKTSAEQEVGPSPNEVSLNSSFLDVSTWNKDVDQRTPAPNLPSQNIQYGGSPPIPLQYGPTFKCGLKICLEHHYHTAKWCHKSEQSRDCPMIRYDTKYFEAKRNFALKRYVSSIQPVNLGFDWARIGIQLEERNAGLFELQAWGSFQQFLHPGPIELHTVNSFHDEHLRTGPSPRGEDDTETASAKRLLDLLDEMPENRDITTAEELEYWNDKYRRFWYVILHAARQLPLGDPRQDRLVNVLDKLYEECQRPPHQHTKCCRGHCLKRETTPWPVVTGTFQGFPQERHLMLWERLAESWNAYEVYAPRFPSRLVLRERPRAKRFEEARGLDAYPEVSTPETSNPDVTNLEAFNSEATTESNSSLESFILVQELNVMIGPEFDPYAPRNGSFFYTTDEWIRLNAFLARFVRLRGDCEPFVHHKGRMYNVLWMKGVYCLIEAFETSHRHYGSEDDSLRKVHGEIYDPDVPTISEIQQHEWDIEVLLAAIGAASQWIMLGRLTPGWLNKVSLYLCADHAHDSQRTDIRDGRKPHAFGDLYGPGKSANFFDRFDFWMQRLENICLSWPRPLTHRESQILEMARVARLRADEDWFEDGRMWEFAGNGQEGRIPEQLRIPGYWWVFD